MALNEIKKQVVLVLQSVLTLDSTGRTEAMGFLKDCAINFGLTGLDKGKIYYDQSDIFNSENEVLKIDSEGSFNVNKIVDNKQSQNIGCQDDRNVANTVDNVSENVFNHDSNKQPSLTISSKPNCSLAVDLFNEVESRKHYIKGKHNNGKKIGKSKTSRRKISTSKEIKGSLDLKPPEEKEIVKSDGTSLEELNLSETKCESKKPKKNVKDVKKKDGKDDNGVFKCPGCMVTCVNKADLLLHFGSHSKVPISCRLCRSNFNNLLTFWKHQKNQECKVYPFKCAECGEKFKYRRHYLKHVLGHNDNNCRHCDDKFSTWILYKHHLKKKHPDIKMERDLIPCKFCAMGFRRHLGLYNHYQVEHSKGKFVCLSCGLLLPTKEKYKEHALVHESEKSWKCKICKMKFYRRQQLLFHVSVHKSGTYKCLTCNITVTSKVDLYKHKKDGHEVKGLEPKFECGVCHKNFKKKVVLKNHMATHSEEKKYYCKYCLKSFRTLEAFQKHQKRKTHFEKAKIILPESKYEKVYEDKLICECCGKQYKTQRELTWHLRVHKSIYKCHECGKTFTLKVNLTKHIRLHRNKVCVMCELCGNTFNQLSALNEHNLMKHSDVRNAECEVCKKKFKRKSELNRHRRIHEQKRPFACFCGTAFKQSSHLQTHYKTFHEKTTDQNNLMQAASYTTDASNGVFNGSVIDRQKQTYVTSEQGTILSLGNMEPQTDYRNVESYDNVQVNENHESKAPYVNNYTLRYSQNVMDPISVTYEGLNFGASQSDKRELVFSSPAVDLSMVGISEVVQNGMALGQRAIAESVESFNKMPVDASNIQLVNLSDHIVQEYLLNLPQS